MLHRQKEKEKWGGTSRTNKASEGDENIEDNDNNDDNTEKVPGHIIVHHLLEQEVQLMPATIDAYMRE
eukprot:12800307-Ditylum_brightwellii.AAC.1